ncbi:MAG: hypothetical protein J0L78_09565 [Planctomycetes bacterium]|nr:hypothetical protein [Planctomycetota bacterium]
MMYAQVQKWLTERMSLDASLLQGAGFESLVAERLRACGCGDELGYLALLARSGDEGELLAGSIAVPETWFFRYPRSFELLVEYLERMLRAGAPMLRLVSVGCASGEEPYGMAMAALHAGWTEDRVQIDGFDRSEAALARARAAEYGSFSIRHEVPGWAVGFLKHEGGRIAVCDRVRSMVRFERADVLDRRVLAQGGPYGAVFCRNVLIYLDAAARARLLDSIAETLAEGGLLFVGHAEQMVAVSARMRRIENSHAFALERVRGVESTGRESAGGGVVAVRSAERRGAEKIPVRERGIEFRAGSIPAAATRAGGPAIATPVEATLEGARELADAGRVRESEEMIRAIVARKGPTAAALELLGTLRQASKDPAGAKTLFEQALYLEPARTTSLLQLALIYESNGDASRAERMWERVRRSRDAVPAANNRGEA